MTAPSPDAPGQREADAGGEVEARTERQLFGALLGSWLRDEGWSADECEELADEVLRSDELAAHDASVVAAARADADARLGEVAEALEACQEQRADLLELVELQRRLRAAVEAEVESAYQVGANYVMCRSLRVVLDAAGPRREGTT